MPLPGIAVGVTDGVPVVVGLIVVEFGEGVTVGMMVPAVATAVLVPVCTTVANVVGVVVGIVPGAVGDAPIGGIPVGSTGTVPGGVGLPISGGSNGGDPISTVPITRASGLG